jgi:hypothetical protein
MIPSGRQTQRRELAKLGERAGQNGHGQPVGGGWNCIHMPNNQTTSDEKRVRDHVRKVLVKLAALQKQKRAQIEVSH